MKLRDIFEQKFSEEQSDLKYIFVSLNESSKNKLNAYVESKNIPHALPPSEYHITVMYSTTPIHDYPVDSNLRNKKVVPQGFDLFTGQDGNDCLVLKVNSEFLQERHRRALKAGATYTFADYKPHVTLSYNRNGFDYKSLKVSDVGDLFIEHEVIEPLDLEYAQSLTKT